MVIAGGKAFRCEWRFAALTWASVCNQWVAGSIPVAGSTQTKGVQPMVAPFSYTI